MLHAAMLDGPEDVATAMAIKEGCKRVSSELYVQQQCEALMSGKPANEVAVGIASVAGYGGCIAMGTGPIVAGLCATAAAAVADWLFGEYTPAERAQIVYRAARKDDPISKLGDIYCYGYGQMCNRSNAADLMRDVSRHNLTLLGVPNVWTKPEAQAVSVIIMAIAAAGIGDESIGWFTKKRSIGDLPSPPRPKPSGLQIFNVGKLVLSSYPAGSITAWDAKRSAFRIAVPRASLAGAPAPLVEVASSPTAPEGVPLVPLAQLEDQTGQRRWYRDWRTYAVIGGLAAAGTAGVVIYRRRRR